jgi:AraC-like DNA-binding protein
MRRPDRHNEIELNYLPEGSLTYLFQDRRVQVPSRRLALFWSLIPHQIIHSEGIAPYYVCTIPFSLFLSWGLPQAFTEKLFKGELLLDAEQPSDEPDYDAYMLRRMLGEVGGRYFSEIVSLELHARFLRMASAMKVEEGRTVLPVVSGEISLVEQIAIYIARNYRNPIKVADVGAAVGLHPDYANALFKKTFGVTLGEYIVEERIAHAQRLLVSTTDSVADIVFQCGFGSVSSFNAAFLKLNACTPREFRKRFR